MQALWMVLASFWFALMAVGIKYASNSFSTFELVFYRGLVSIVFMGIVVRASGSSLRTPVPLMHVWRSTIGVTSLGAWFYAIAHLPLATAMTHANRAPLTQARHQLDRLGGRLGARKPDVSATRSALPGGISPTTVTINSPAAVGMRLDTTAVGPS